MGYVVSSLFQSELKTKFAVLRNFLGSLQVDIQDLHPCKFMQDGSHNYSSRLELTLVCESCRISCASCGVLSL